MRILHLENSPRDAELVRVMLTAEWPDCDITVVVTRDAFLKELNEGDYDIVLSNFEQPGFKRLEALELVRGRCPHTPFIFLAGTRSEAQAMEAVRAGAADFTTKDQLQRLTVSLQRIMREAEDQGARRRLEDAYAQQQYLLLVLMENLPEQVYFKDINSHFLTVSHSMARQHGIHQDELKGKSDADLFSKEHAQKARADEERIIRTGRPLLNMEEKEIWPDGSITWVLTSKLPLRDEAGTIVGTFGISRDITERKKTDTRLRLQGSALESADNAIVITDREGIIEWVNPAFSALTGYSLAEASGKNPRELVKSGQHDDAFYKNLWTTIMAGKVWHGEMINRRKNGTLYHESQTITPVRDDHDQISHFIAIKEDITARKQAEAAAREQAEIIDQVPLAIIITDLSHRVTYCNEGAKQLYGMEAEELLGHTAAELFTTETLQQLMLGRSATLTTGKWHGEVPVQTRKGRQAVAEFFMHLIRDEDGQPKARLSIAIDITEKKIIEEKFLRVQRLENLGMLAAGIAHDLNNILAPVLMGVPLLRIRAVHPSDLRVLQTIETCAERGAALVRQILSFAHGAGGAKTLIQIKHLMRDIDDLLQETFPKSITLQHEIPNDLWPVLGDPTQLHQVLLNLCVNARDAMPQGGTLRLRAENRIIRGPVLAAFPGISPGSYLVVEVIDTGSGIPPEILERIWDPFFTTKSEGKGTGLGLATVRGIAINHGGFVTVESEPGRGTSFQVFLPAAEQPSALSPAEASNHPFPRGQGELVLIVDDEVSIRDVFAAYLMRFGYRVVVAANGIEAMSIYAIRVEEVALVVTDLGMPEMGGNELAMALSRLNPAVRILYMSGSDGGNLGETMPNSARILNKPFSCEALLTAVQKALETPPTSSRS